MTPSEHCCAAERSTARKNMKESAVAPLGAASDQGEDESQQQPLPTIEDAARLEWKQNVKPAPAAKVRRGRPKGSGTILTQEERKERRRLNNRRAAHRSAARKMCKQAQLEIENDSLRKQLKTVKQLFAIYQHLEEVQFLSWLSRNAVASTA